MQGNSPEARAISEQLRDSLNQLRDVLNRMLTDKVVDDFADISSPLKLFVEAVHAPVGTPNREPNFHDRSRLLSDHALRCANTGWLESWSF